MNVKELFVSVGFDAIAKALKNTHRNDRSIECLSGYKEAFDIICNTEFDGDGGEVTFDVTPKEEWSEPYSLPMLARNVEGDYWKNTVGKTVIRPDENPFTDAELAGAILWGMTFYGFNRHSSWSPFEERYNSYGKMADRLERKQYLPYIRDKRIKRELKSKEALRFGIAFSQKIWDAIHFREKHQNRSKRKRFYRIEKRIEELKRLDKRQHLIDLITCNTGIPEQEIRERVINAGSIHESWRESHVYGKSSRVEYLADLLANYSPTLSDLCNKCDDLIIIAYTSEEMPITTEEYDRLCAEIKPFITDRVDVPTLIKGIDNEAKEEIAIQIIGIISESNKK